VVLVSPVDPDPRSQISCFSHGDAS
jgi:hypothetical protein